MKRLIPLSVVFGVLVVLMAMREAQRPQAGSSDADGLLTSIALQVFEPDDVITIEVDAPGAPSFALERRGEGDWIVTAPFRAPASAGRAAALARALANGAGELRSDDAESLAAFDLTDDRAVLLTARGKESVLAHVQLGRSSGPQGAFVRLPTSGGSTAAVFAVTSPLRGALGLAPTPAGPHDPPSPDPSFFHDAAFPSLDLQTAAAVVRTTPRNRVGFARQDNAWIPQGGGTLPPRQGAVTNVLRGLAGAVETRGLVDPEAARRAGLGAPTHRLDVVLADGERRSILGVADADRFYVRLDTKRDPDVVYSLEPGAWARVFPPGAALFEMGRLNVPARTLGRLRIERRGGTTLDMTRKDGHERNDWVVSEPKWPLPVLQQQLRGLPVTLGFVRPVDWMDASAQDLGLGEPDLVVLYGKDTEALGDLGEFRVYGSAPGGRGDRLAQMPGIGKIVVITQAMLDKIAPDPITLHRRQILRGLDLGVISGVEVARRDDSAGPWRTDFALALENEAWTVSAGGLDDPADGDTVEAWVRRVLALEADGIAGPEADGAVVRITLRRHRGDPWTLEFTNAEEGRRVVRRAGAAFVTRGLGRIPDADAFRAR